jgi:hypothetical protein
MISHYSKFSPIIWGGKGKGQRGKWKIKKEKFCQKTGGLGLPIFPAKWSPASANGWDGK